MTIFRVNVCYRVARKDTNHFSARVVGVMMIQGKNPLAGFWREFSQPSCPCMEMLIRDEPRHHSPRKWGSGSLYRAALAFLQGLILDTAGLPKCVKKQTLRFLRSVLISAI